MYTAGGLRSDVGTSALIAAGCLNLALRAFSAWNFLTGRFARSGILLRLHEVSKIRWVVGARSAQC